MNAKTNKNINYIYYTIFIIALFIFGFIIRGCYQRDDNINGNDTQTDNGNTQTESELIRTNKQLASDLDAARKTNIELTANNNQLTNINNHLTRQIADANATIKSINDTNSKIANAIGEIKQAILSGEAPEDIIDAATEKIAAICKVLANGGNK